jgi:hypothetical protein
LTPRLTANMYFLSSARFCALFCCTPHAKCLPTHVGLCRHEEAERLLLEVVRVELQQHLFFVVVSDELHCF